MMVIMLMLMMMIDNYDDSYDVTTILNHTLFLCFQKQSKTFETWQQLKADTRQEQSNKYKQKTSLQKELIRAREQLHQERKQDSEQHEKQVR